MIAVTNYNCCGFSTRSVALLILSTSVLVGVLWNGDMIFLNRDNDNNIHHDSFTVPIMRWLYNTNNINKHGKDLPPNTHHGIVSFSQLPEGNFAKHIRTCHPYQQQRRGVLHINDNNKSTSPPPCTIYCQPSGTPAIRSTSSTTNDNVPTSYTINNNNNPCKNSFAMIPYHLIKASSSNQQQNHHQPVIFAHHLYYDAVSCNAQCVPKQIGDFRFGECECQHLPQ